MKHTNYIVCYGNVIEGFSFVGPFTIIEEAIQWAEVNAENEWEVTPLTPATPVEFNIKFD